MATQTDAHITRDILAERQRTDDFAAAIEGWFWETDATHRYIYLSPNVEKYTGLTPEWHYGKRRKDMGCPESITPEEWQTHIDDIERRQPIVNFVYRRYSPTGDLWLQTSGNPIFDAQGNFKGYRGTASDVSAEIETRDRAIRLTSAIEEKNRILETTLRTIPDGVAVMDDQTNLVAWNDQLFEVLDLDKGSVFANEHPGGVMFRAMAERGEYGQGDMDDLIAERVAIMRAGKSLQYERQLVSGRWIECRGTPILGGRFMTIYRDVTQLRHLIEKLEQQASLDPLTGALNRRKFAEIAQREFNRAQRFARPLSFVVLDLDHFKAVNDTHGHAAGDAALCEVVALCKKGLRETDHIGRFGGEEFVLMLPETDINGAEVVANRLRLGVEAMIISIESAEIHLTISAGAAEVGPGHQSVDDVIAAADDALYQAKRDGRNKVVCHLMKPTKDQTLAARF